MSLLTRTKQIAKLRGLSLTEVAIKSNLAEKSIYSWDRSNPKSENLKAVAKTLNVSTDYLLGNTDEMVPRNIKQMPQVDLYKVEDSERDELISANGQPISDEDWLVIKAILSKYPKKHEE